MTLAEYMICDQRETRTENGAYAHNTTGSALLDLFALAGALRSRENGTIRRMYIRAMAEEPVLALKLAFYSRDVRGGLGERDTGRVFFRTLAEVYPDRLRPNLSLIPEYGRWDDLLCVLGTPLEEDALQIVRHQLEADTQAMLAGKPVSLLAKWMPGANASSTAVRKTGRLLAAKLGMDQRTYRKVLSQLRSYLNLTEKNLSQQTDSCIRYGEVPSRAMSLYRKAFRRRDGERFEAFLEGVRAGTETIHSGVLYPYDIAEKYLYGGNGPDEVLEAQWKALPDYTEGGGNILVMADVSGSMYGRPLAASVGLALYFAERAKGPFHNRFMTFSAMPELVEVRGETLYERIHAAQNAHWDMNTDLEAAFMCILRTARRHGVSPEDMPKSLVVISDMEIDHCTKGRNRLFSEEMRTRFEEAGYTIPNLVFWNVSARQNTFHASKETQGVQLASGYSASVFESLVEGSLLTPWEYMVKTLSGPRYARIL